MYHKVTKSMRNSILCRKFCCRSHRSHPAAKKAEVHYPLEETNLGEDGFSQQMYISKLLEPETRARLICLLQEFKDCLAWKYSKIPGLDQCLVEHQLLIKKGYKPYKQPPRRMSDDMVFKIKEEVERLLKVGFVRTASYVQ